MCIRLSMYHLVCAKSGAWVSVRWCEDGKVRWVEVGSLDRRPLWDAAAQAFPVRLKLTLHVGSGDSWTGDTIVSSHCEAEDALCAMLKEGLSCKRDSDSSDCSASLPDCSASLPDCSVSLPDCSASLPEGLPVILGVILVLILGVILGVILGRSLSG